MGFRHAHFCMNDYPYCFCTGFCHAHFCTNYYPSYSCMGFCHAHFRTNDYPYYYGFLSRTWLYEWLSILFLYWFSSCKFLYEWLFIFLWVFVMHIFVRMTIHISFWMGFCHAYSCTNDYSYSYGFLSWTWFYEWISILFLNGFCHAHFSTNDYPFFCVWVYAMHISVQMTIHIIFVRVFVLNIYVWMTIPILLGFSSCTWLYKWIFCSKLFSNAFLLNRNSEFLGVFSLNVSVLPCAQCSPTRE